LTENKIIIIGAGIAGLATGCYARKNGFNVEIFEAHDKPGGMCTSWQRKDFIFDYCIHNLMGTSPKSGLYNVWLELGALDKSGVICHEEFVRVETSSGEALHWYTDLERLKNHLRQIAPEDSTATDELINAARKLAGADLSAMQLGGMGRMLKALPRLSLIKRLNRTTVGQFVASLKNPFLRRALMHIMYDMPGDLVPMMALALFMASMSRGDLAWPKGGSLAFSRNVEKSFLDLGGQIHYKKRVEKILVEDDRAVGTVLGDGTEHRADIIISAADGYDTIYRMLEGRYLTPDIEDYYGSVGDSSPFGFFVFLGLNGELTGEPHALTLLYDDEFDLGDIKQDSLHVVTYGPETGLVPAGKSIIKIEVQASYSYWKKRRDADLKDYRAEKQRIADIIIDRLSTRFPNLRERIEVIDACTPPTAERYTGNRYGWQAGPPRENAAGIQRVGLSKILPGLNGFYHVGQWSMANLGVSSAAVMARNLVKELCKIQGKRFSS
jgi:phytoene dehydrogenase-like protein